MKDYLVCTNCGGKDKFLEKEKGKLVCLYCGSIIVEKEDENKYQELLESINNQKDSLINKIDQQEKNLVANAICNLRAEIDKQFPDNKLLLSYAKEVKTYIPNHFLANVLELLSSKQYVQLNEYLSSYDYREISQELLEYVIKKLIENIESSIELTIATIIESYVIDDNTKTILFTDYEKELDKLNKATYECSLLRDIFVAHSSKDNKEALEIVNYLEGMGYTCWVSTRNLRHGVNAKAIYEDSIKAAIKNCSVFLLLGSKNSRNRQCDAYKIEMPHVIDIDRENQPKTLKNLPNQWDNKYKKPRIEYMIDKYSEPLNPFDKYTKDFFSGYNNCTNKEQLANVIEDLLNTKYEETPVEEEKEQVQEELEIIGSNIQVKSFSNGIYEGEIENNKLNGYGTFKFNNGQVYEGEWKDNKYNGHGTLTLTDGKKQEGEWKDGKFLGTNVEDKKEIVKEENNVSKDNITETTITTKKETIKYPNGDVYEGETLNGKKHGQGKMTYAEGNEFKRKEYNGEWKDDIFNGYGVMKWADGDVYEGEWKDDKRNGHGIHKYADGDVYDGEYKDGEYNGHGVYKWVDGRVYDGEWKDNKRNGHGVYKWADGTVFDGEWKDGKRNGHGVMKYADGRVYEGEWKDGKANGHGVMKWADGRVYDGEWKDDKANGHGVMKWADGRVYEGEYKDGKLNGHGVYKWVDGRVYDGEWKDDKANGHGVMKWADDTIQEGEWKEGKFLETKEEVKVEGIKDVLNNNSISTSSNERPYKKSISSVEFGLYPQTQVTDTTLINTLNKKTGPLPTSNNPNKWTSYKYYIEEKVQDYMWYIDIEEGDSKYRGVYFTKYRPMFPMDDGSSENSMQKANGYIINTVYWFKYEPIKWSILKESNGYATLISDIAIDAQEYYSSDSEETHEHNGGTGYSNNYALSNIRKWLNETFYNTAFSGKQKSIIKTIEVDNSLASTGYDSNPYMCENTNDMLYLLSDNEIDEIGPTEKICSDYAESQGCASASDKTCDWWLRSSNYNSGWNSNYVSCDGCVVEYGDGKMVDDDSCGVVPALTIKL